MIRIHPAPALFFVLAACTPLDAREPTVGGPRPVVVPDDNPSTAYEPERPPVIETGVDVRIAVASVQLEEDCPDPPSAPPPSTPAAAESPAILAPGAPAKRMAGYRPSRSCQQSALQLRFTNEGDAAAAITIAAIELLDVQSGSVLAPVPSRLPAAFTADGSYQPWDGRVAAGAEFHASYRLTPPSWSMIDGKVGNSRGRELVLEITVEIDGKPTTVRSPAFTRPPELVMPPT